MSAKPSSPHHSRRGTHAGTRRRLPALAAITAALLVSATACFPQFGGSGEHFSPDPKAAEGAPAGLEKFYSQKLNFTDCQGGYKCAQLTVPLDYAKPAGETIQIALIDKPASGKKQGYLVTNPGGPGGSGVNFVRDSGKQLFTSTVRAAYDVIGFDPRGVQNSAPVKCLTDAQIDAERQQNEDLDTDPGYDAAKAENARDAQECAEKTGPVLGHVDTESAVKDMDVLRATLGEPKLNYLGFSYGTKLGYTYAQRFTDKVGRFVLDGAMQPGLSIQDVGMGQAKAFENELAQFAKKCVADHCSVGSSPKAVVAKIRDMQKQLDTTPQKASDGRLVTGGEFNSGLSLPMYSTSLWGNLENALNRAVHGDVDAMLALADYAADRDPNTGKYTTNANFAFNAINCLDYPMTDDKAAMRGESAALEQAAPTFGQYLGYSGLLCGQWPFHAQTDPKPISVHTQDPIVVVGTTRDPATPYQWAQGLHSQLTNSTLLTFDGDGHTAYGRSNDCITNAVDTYLASGTAPQDGKKC